MPYVDLNSIHNPATGTIAPASWGDQVRDNLEFLIDPPACSVSASTGQTVTTATPTVLTADTELYDNDGMHSTVSNTSRITAQTAGRYRFTAYARFATGSTGYRIVRFKVNGGTTHVLSAIDPCSAATIVTVTGGSKTLVMAAGDYVEVEVQHSQGANLAVQLDEFSAKFDTR